MKIKSRDFLGSDGMASYSSQLSKGESWHYDFTIQDESDCVSFFGWASSVVELQSRVGELRNLYSAIGNLLAHIDDLSEPEPTTPGSGVTPGEGS